MWMSPSVRPLLAGYLDSCCLEHHKLSSTDAIGLTLSAQLPDGISAHLALTIMVLEAMHDLYCNRIHSSMHICCIHSLETIPDKADS